MHNRRPGTSRRGATSLATALFGSLVLLLSACGSATGGDTAGSAGTAAPKANQNLVQSDDTPRTGGSLAYGLNAETNGWNPANNQWGAPGLQVSKAIFDTLTTYDEHSQIKPFL